MQRLQIIIPVLAVIAVAALGSLLTGDGMTWYDTIVKPDLTPPDWIFPIAWNLIYFFTTVAVILIWRQGEQDKSFLFFFKKNSLEPRYKFLLTLFVLNGILNVLWSYLFFNLHRIDLALIDILFLELTNLFLIISAWPKSKSASLLLLPYAVWVGFATYLNWQLFLLN